MKKHNKSILALFIVISLLAASLCAVPAYASKPDYIESADLERTSIEYETLFATFRYSGYMIEFPGTGLTIMNDDEAAIILERINGEGELSYGRVGSDHDIDLEKYSLVYLRKFYLGLSGAKDDLEEVIDVSMTEDGDLVIASYPPGDFWDLPNDEFGSGSLSYAIIALKKSDIERLDENSVVYLGNRVNPTTLFEKTKLELSIEGADRFGCAPRTQIGFETLYEKYGHSLVYFTELFERYFPVSSYGTFAILNDTASKDLLERINGDGELSDGRIGGDHEIDLETQCLAVLISHYNPDVYQSFSAELTDLSITRNGNLIAKMKGEFDYHGEIPWFSDSKRFTIVFAIEKEKTDGLNEKSRIIMEEPFLRKNDGNSLWILDLPVEEPIVLPPHDVNADGAFDAKDLTHLMRVIAGDNTAVAMRSADINDDGTVDVKDLTRMMKLLAAV